MLVATIVSGWLRMAISLVIGLISTPILVRLLGTERFGAVRVAEQWFAYLEFLRFGLGPAVGVLLIRAATSGTAADVRAIARAGFLLLLLQIRWILPVAAVMVAVFPSAFGLPTGLWAEFYRAALPILIGAGVGPIATFRSVLEARQRGYLVNAGLVFQNTVVAGLGIGFAAAGFGLSGQMWATTLGLIAFGCMCAHFSGMTDRRFWATPRILLHDGKIWRLQWPLLVTGIGNQINILSDNILAGMLVGVAQVTPLILTQRLFQLCTMVAGSLNGSGTWAGLVELRTKAGPGAFRTRLAEVSRLNVGLNLLVLAPVLACNRRFVGLWVGDQLYAGDWVTLATFAQMAVFNFLCLYAALLDSFGRTRERVWVSTAGTAIKVALVIPLTRWLGLSGLPLASLIGYLCTDAWYCPWILSRDEGVPRGAIFDGVGRAAAVGGGWAGICYLIGIRTDYMPVGWAGLFAEAAALEAFSLAIAWFLLLSASDRHVWRARVRGWTSRKAPGPDGETDT